MGTSTASRSLKWWQIAAFAFAFTSSGPFGIESCCSSGGAALTIASIFITPIVYVIPQVLMVCELSGMNPTNEGHVAWVERGWGRAAAAFNTYNALLVNSIDLSLYVVLSGSYVQQSFFPDATFWHLFLVRVVFVVVGFLIALRSATIVSDAALLLVLLIILPFVVFFFIALPDIDSSQWNWMPTELVMMMNSTNSSNKQQSFFVEREKTDWAQFCASSLWLYTGWNSMGALGGDVDEKSGGGGDNDGASTAEKNPKQQQQQQPAEKPVVASEADAQNDETSSVDNDQQQPSAPAAAPPKPTPQKHGISVLFTGLSTALVIAIFMYVLPLMTALSVPTVPKLPPSQLNASSASNDRGDFAEPSLPQQPEEPWQDGYLSVAIGRVVRGGGIVVSVAGLVSMLSLFVASLACFARLVWGMAMRGWLPAFLKQADAKSKSPVVATVAQCIAVLPCLLVSFGYLQRIEFCLASVSYILTFTSFLRMRYTEPDAHRPFLVPGGMFVAWLITLSKVLVFIVILITNFSDRSLMLGVVCVNAAIAMLYFVKKKDFDKAPSPVEDEGNVPSPQMPSPSAGLPPPPVSSDDERAPAVSASAFSATPSAAAAVSEAPVVMGGPEDDGVEMLRRRSHGAAN